MNDVGYINCEYKESTAYNTVITATKEQLQHRRRYTEMAINFHKKENNSNQIKFFTEELKLIDKRLKNNDID